jgi:methionine-rich copper-binding protein CopC
VVKLVEPVAARLEWHGRRRSPAVVKLVGPGVRSAFEWHGWGRSSAVVKPVGPVSTRRSSPMGVAASLRGGHVIRTRTRRLGMWALVLAGLTIASLASGHALLVDSIPRQGEAVGAVSEIVLRFNSRIEKGLSSITLVGPQNSPIALRRSDHAHGLDTLAYGVPALSPGSYQAKWKVLSTDGHLTEGILTFQVTELIRRE